jgi:hypothetical protein
MTSFTSKSLKVQDPRPIGEIIQSPYDLTKVSTQFARCDGRIVNRFVYPQLANLIPQGVLTFTTHTTNQNSNASACAADDTNFLISSLSANSIQASPDGITWTNGSGWTANNIPNTIIRANTRFIAMASVGVDYTTPLVTATGQTAAATVIKSNWTATTVATGVGDPGCLAYSPQLGSAIFVPNTAASTTFYTLADGATAWVARTAPSSQQKTAVTWDGKYFWITNAGALTTLTRWDGTVAIDVTIPMAISSTTIASDGAGTTVLITGTDTTIGNGGSGVIVSKDFGTTWSFITVPQSDTNLDIGYQINIANGLFKLGGIAPMRISKDGLVWTTTGNAPALLNNYSFTYKAGVYFMINSSSGIAHQTFTEDVSKMVMPRTQRKASNIGLTGNIGWQEWIKVS